MLFSDALQLPLDPTHVNERYTKLTILGTHFQISEQSGIVTKSKQIPEANGRRACRLNFEVRLDRISEDWRDDDASLTLSLSLSG